MSKPFQRSATRYPGYYITWLGETQPTQHELKKDIADGQLFSTENFDPNILSAHFVFCQAGIHQAFRYGQFNKKENILDWEGQCQVLQGKAKHHYCADHFVLGRDVKQLKKIFLENEETASVAWLNAQDRGCFIKPDRRLDDKQVFGLTAHGSVFEVPYGQGILWQHDAGSYVRVKRDNVKAEAEYRQTDVLEKWLVNSVFPKKPNLLQSITHDLNEGIALTSDNVKRFLAL